MATSKKGPTKRTIQLKRRAATVTNLNFQPEKSGDELVERVDLSLNFVVMDMDVDEVINTKGNPLNLLWDKDGGTMFRELEKLVITTTFEGSCEIGLSDETMLEFKTATLKKVSVEPHQGRQCRVVCQVRLDPTGSLEELGQIRIHQDCVFAFEGSGVAKGKNKDQAELEV